MSGEAASWDEAVRRREEARNAGQTVVFTNGCFDLLHRGHVDLLRAARALGDVLIVGLNGDDSVRRLKGPDRPLVTAGDRAAVLSALRSVDLVVVFDEDTPDALIRGLRPDVLVKGADYRAEEVVGAAFVNEQGGRTVVLPLTPGCSTSGLVRRLRAPGFDTPSEG